MQVHCLDGPYAGQTINRPEHLTGTPEAIRLLDPSLPGYYTTEPQDTGPWPATWHETDDSIAAEYRATLS